MWLISSEEVLSISNGQVRSPELFLRTGQPTDDGLFSYTIFGMTPSERFSRFGHIELNIDCFTPHFFELLGKAYRKEIDHIMSLKPYKIDKDGIQLLQEDDGSGCLYGLVPLTKNIDRLPRKDTLSSNDLFRMLDKFGVSRCVINRILVIPAGFRDFVTTKQYPEINLLYSRLIRLCSSVNTLDPKAVSRMSCSVQNLLQSIYHLIESMISKKRGLIRSAILGKRMDFSGRAVATIDPSIRPDEIGLPLKIAVKIFEPWILHHISNTMNLPHERVLLNLDKISKGQKVDRTFIKNVETFLGSLDRYVIIKRDPDLHRLSTRPYKFRIVHDDTIHASPFICSGHGLDFDGDTLSVYCPLSEEAQQELKEAFDKSVWHPGALGYDISLDISHEYKGALVLLTCDPIDANFEFHQPTVVNGVKTTEGRKRIYEILVEYFKDLDFNKVNCLITKDLLTYLIFSYDLPPKKIVDLFYDIQKLLTEVLIKCTTALDLNHLMLSEKFREQAQKISNIPDDLEKYKEQDKLYKQVLEEIKRRDELLYIMIENGVFKKDQILQMIGCKGMVTIGNTVHFVPSSFASSLSPTQVFTASYGSRSGIVRRTLSTSISGYLDRKLRYALASVEIDPDIEYCGTVKRLELDLTPDLFKKLQRRYIITSGRKLTVLSVDDKDLIGKKIELFTPIYCKSERLCVRCCGDIYRFLGTRLIGAVASRSIGERMTQNLLKAFHVGGIVSLKKIDFFEDVERNTGLSRQEIEKFLTTTDGNSFQAKKDCVIELEKDSYSVTLLKRGEPQYSTMLIFKIEDMEIVYSYDVVIHPPRSVTRSDRTYRLSYKEGDTIFETSYLKSDAELSVRRLLAAVEGRTKVASEKQLYNLILDLTKDLGTVSSLYYEILISQIMRSSNDPSKPWRLDQSSIPEFVSIKSIPYLESPLRALQFENFGKSITNILTHSGIERRSFIDRLGYIENSE